MFLPVADMSDTALYYLPSLRRSGMQIYYLVILFVFTGIGSLFFLHVDIAVQATGIIRPAQERTNIRALVSGTVDSLYVRDGERVEKNKLILSIRDHSVPVKRQMAEEEIGRQRNFIHDLSLLTGNRVRPDQVLPLLLTSLYREQAERFSAREAEQKLNVKKADHEADIYGRLVRDKVISPKEFFDAEIVQGKTSAAYKAFRQEQFSVWSQDLINCKAKLSELLARNEEFLALNENYKIRAPVSGVLQGLNAKYPGSSVQPDEIICSVSPEGPLVGECYVSSRDMGLLKKSQPARFQIDAFNYNYFGVLKGCIISLDNDFTLVDNKPAFKIICRFDENKLQLKNGYQGEIKKGLTFRARFICGTRSLWQLLYDRMDDWFNPVAPADPLQ